MRFSLPSFFALAAGLLLPSCVGAPERPVSPAPARRPAAAAPLAPAPAPVPASVEWQYRPTSPGLWTYAAQGRGSAAVFTSPGGGAALTLRCDSATRSISVVRAGAGQGAMTLRTSYGAASWPASATTAGTLATRAASDAALDQIAYSRGRFAVEVAGLETLILPAWAEVGRVVEDCRG